MFFECDQWSIKTGRLLKIAGGESVRWQDAFSALGGDDGRELEKKSLL